MLDFPHPRVVKICSVEENRWFVVRLSNNGSLKIVLSSPISMTGRITKSTNTLSKVLWLLLLLPYLCLQSLTVSSHIRILGLLSRRTQMKTCLDWLFVYLIFRSYKTPFDITVSLVTTRTFKTLQSYGLCWLPKGFDILLLYQIFNTSRVRLV